MTLPESTARERFTAAPVVRMATADANGRPHIVVSTFTVDGDRIYLTVDEKPKSTRRLKRLRNIEVNPAVSLLVDHYTYDWRKLWWVRADGRAEVVTEPAMMTEPLRLLIMKYPQYRETPPGGPVIEVIVDRWTGWAARPDGTVA